MAKIKTVIGSLIATLIISCTPGKFQIPPNAIVQNIDSLNSFETAFSEFTKSCSSNKLIFIFLDNSCSSCLLELEWWKLFIKKHPELNPVFIINHPPEAFTPFEYFVRNSHVRGYPAIKDTNFSIKYLNKLTNNDYCVITDTTLQIIYKGNPNKREIPNY